jgi:hypothetical protein
MPVGELADCLRELERAESAHTAARARMLAAFTAQCGYEADGHGGPKPWLIWQTRITRGAAEGALGWSRRLAEHPHVADALTAGEVTESWARKICGWTDQLPEDCRADADQILLAAADGGADLADLHGLVEEILSRCGPPDRDGDDGFARRAVSLSTHFQAAGHLDGNLTPECAAALQAVLDSLGKKAGPEDDRTKAQRRHDALEGLPAADRQQLPARRRRPAGPGAAAHDAGPGPQLAGRVGGGAAVGGPAGLAGRPRRRRRPARLGHRPDSGRGLCLRRPDRPDSDRLCRPRRPGRDGRRLARRVRRPGQRWR